MLKLLLRAGGPGQAKAVFKAKGDNVPTPVLPLTLPVLAQLQATNGQCWGTAHYPAGTSQNTSAQFKSKDGSPSGAFMD